MYKVWNTIINKNKLNWVEYLLDDMIKYFIKDWNFAYKIWDIAYPFKLINKDWIDDFKIFYVSNLRIDSFYNNWQMILTYYI